MPCVRHPTADRHQVHCAACLFEEALAATAAPLQPDLNGTIQLPLGRTGSSSVFLVKGGGPDGRLLRLKTWHTAAPPGFMTRFERLQRQLSEWDHEAVPVPLAAWVDASGRPSVLSEFHQGVPILERLTSGGLDSTEAEGCLARLLVAVRIAHARGLVHGSIVGGNIIVAAHGNPAYLLDFGHAALVAPGDDVPAPGADGAGFDRLIETARGLSSPGPARQ